MDKDDFSLNARIGRQSEDNAARLLDIWQMFEGPIARISVAGRPISCIPESAMKYPSFLKWWFEVGRLKPDDAQGWSAVSGRWAMKDRAEAISKEEWEALPTAEQELISSWTKRLPIGCFYD